MNALINPVIHATSVTPDDNNDLPARPTRGVYVGTSGDLKVDLKSGTTVTFSSLAAGVIHPLQVMRIYATGTTAANILACY